MDETVSTIVSPGSEAKPDERVPLGLVSEWVLE